MGIDAAMAPGIMTVAETLGLKPYLEGLRSLGKRCGGPRGEKKGRMGRREWVKWGRSTLVKGKTKFRSSSGCGRVRLRPRYASSLEATVEWEGATRIRTLGFL
jgi:hypothetical protein